jgi:outer membrane lipoprotein LolB
VIVRLAALFFAALLLTSCAELSPSTSNRQQPTSQYRESIDIGGRLTVRYQHDGENESLHGNFNWSQTDKRTTITLSSPLGQTLALIEVTPEMTVLTQNGKPRRMAPDPDALTELALGWTLPIAGMRDWLQGVAIDANGRRFIASSKSESSATVSTQDGWRIQYVSWQDTEGNPASNRPKRIDLARNTTQAGDVSIKLVIDNWQPH